MFIDSGTTRVLSETWTLARLKSRKIIIINNNLELGKKTHSGSKSILDFTLDISKNAKINS